MSQHTPGPWKVVKSTHKRGLGTDWRDIVTEALEFSPSYISEAKDVDAHLIAAAPELLAALEAIVDADAAYGPALGEGLAGPARSAIAKAKGGV